MAIVSTISGRVATLVIDREARRNALDNAALEALITAFERLRLEDVSVVVLTGTGERAFCAGSDLKALAGYGEREVAYHTHLFQACADTIDNFPAATIAAIEGFCLGGGLEVALACDYRIASREATFGFPEVLLNAIPSGGGTIRAARAMGLMRAREMLLFGRKIDAARAEQLNLVSELAEPGTALAMAQAMAQDYAARVAPLTVAMLKGAVMASAEASARASNVLAYMADMAVSRSDAYAAGIGGFASKK